MLRDRLYYELKPFLPWRVRMGLRRILARRKRRLCSDIWPIDEAAGRVPEGWPGWPDGKKFAFVITHDVEGADGLEKCRRLAELEMELGFRSSFNFIPEGPYKVPPALCTWLKDRGFEVGVHDLHHDGKLFATRRGFARKAARINHYLHEWGAAGFRSGFMLHELEWLHDLNLLYDSSTFDTDPFEPQPDAVGTIFPFWVPAPAAQESQATGKDEELPRRPLGPPSPTPSSLPLIPHRRRSGYVELPYTLPQDSTLFVLLREESTYLWEKKCEWIAERGGMALLTTHPDYMAIDGARPRAWEYPIPFYATFIQQISSRCDGAFWHALPKDVATFSRRVFLGASDVILGK